MNTMASRAAAVVTIRPVRSSPIATAAAGWARWPGGPAVG
jgi:hypothetical protein